jgi:hypothetical protein
MRDPCKTFPFGATNLLKWPDWTLWRLTDDTSMVPSSYVPTIFSSDAHKTAYSLDRDRVCFFTIFQGVN